METHGLLSEHATLRLEAASSGDARLQMVSAAIDALWQEVTQLHGVNEAAHQNLHSRISATELSVTDLGGRLSAQESNAATIRQQGGQATGAFMSPGPSEFVDEIPCGTYLPRSVDGCQRAVATCPAAH